MDSYESYKKSELEIALDEHLAENSTQFTADPKLTSYFSSRARTIGSPIKKDPAAADGLEKPKAPKRRATAKVVEEPRAPKVMDEPPALAPAPAPVPEPVPVLTTPAE